MQLNFLQEDLLEHLKHAKNPRVPAAVSARVTDPHEAQPSLLADIPAPPPTRKNATKKQAEYAASRKIEPPTEEKAPGAFKTISEAAEILAVPAYVLRFWESQFSQIHPTKSRGGRRYYRPQDMETLATIKTLLYQQGYTIKGARKALSSLRQDLDLAEKPVPVAKAHAASPIITPRQRTQLGAIRSELLDLRAQLAPYLPALG